MNESNRIAPSNMCKKAPFHAERFVCKSWTQDDCEFFEKFDEMSKEYLFRQPGWCCKHMVRGMRKWDVSECTNEAAIKKIKADIVLESI